MADAPMPLYHWRKVKHARLLVEPAKEVALKCAAEKVGARACAGMNEAFHVFRRERANANQRSNYQLLLIVLPSALILEWLDLVSRVKAKFGGCLGAKKYG